MVPNGWTEKQSLGWIKKMLGKEAIHTGKDGWKIWREGRLILISDGKGGGTVIRKEKARDAIRYVKDELPRHPK